MKAITLWQPWASLVAAGVKTIETRSWRAPANLIGERIAIHAAAKRPQQGLLIGNWLTHWERSDGGDVLGHGLANMATGDDRYLDLPLGAIVGSAVLEACIPMVANVEDIPELIACLEVDDNDGFGLFYEGDEVGTDVSDQIPYGIFVPGRWAWLLTDIKPTSERCPTCTGGRIPGRYGRCPSCAGAGVCAPVPAKGHQRVWDWAMGI